MKVFRRAVVICGFASAALYAADPGPTQPPGAVNPPYNAAGINEPFPDNYYGADHGGSSIVLSYPFVSPFGNTDHSRGVITYYCAPFTPRNSEGVYGMDVWLEASTNGGDWSVAGENSGLADGAGSAYQPINTPNPGPSPAYRFQWTFDDTPLPPETSFRVFVYVYLYNQGGGSQGNFYVASSVGTVNSGLADDAPLISWDASDGAVNPTAVAAGQTYLISATATDDNGNLTAVQVFRNGSAFAAAGGGDGWTSTAAGSSADPAGTVTYTAQATDAAGLTSAIITWTVTTAALQNQPPVASVDASIDLGQAFTPVESGGAGSGGWQFAIGGYTNFNAGATADVGTDLPAGGWVSAWTASAAGSYAFWVSRNGDASYLPSAIAGPYTLTVIDPNAAGTPVTSDPPTVTTPPVVPPAAPTTTTTSTTPVAPTTTTTTPIAPVVTAGSSPAASTSSSSTSSSSSGSTSSSSTSAPSTPSYGIQPVWIPPATTPTPAPASIARIRFNASGHDAAVHSTFGWGSSMLWTDPAGIAASPWPQFTPASAATVTIGSFTLPTE